MWYVALMNYEVTPNNVVEITGEVLSVPTRKFNTCFTEPYYETILKVRRKDTNRVDAIPVLFDDNDRSPGHMLHLGRLVSVHGKLCSRTEPGIEEKMYTVSNPRIFKVGAMANRFNFGDDLRKKFASNKVSLTGYLTKEATLSEQNFGGRDGVGDNKNRVANFILAIDGGEATDYVRCVAWRERAEMVMDAKAGDKIHIKGALNSRQNGGPSNYWVNASYEMEVGK